MCAPPLIMMGVSLAISAASTGIQMAAQKDTARKQRAAMEADYANKQEAAKAQADQTYAANSEQASERTRQARREESAARVAAGESGLAGNSVMSLLDSTQFNAGYDIARIDKNNANALDQQTRELKGIKANTASNINNIRQPDYIGAGLKIAGDAMTSYSQYDKLTNPKPLVD